MKYLAIAISAARNSLASRGALIASALASTLRLFIIFAIYTAAFQQTGGAIRGVSSGAAIWSIGAYFLLLALGARRVTRDVNADIQQGTIEVRRGKPVSYLGWAAADRIGRGLPDFLIFLIVGSTLAWVMAGPPPISNTSSWWIGTLALALGGTILTLILYSIPGLTTFWIDNNDPVFWIVDKTILILGGSFVPVALFPAWLRGIADYTPFGAPMFITRAFSPAFPSAWPQFVGLQVVWITLLGGALWLMWRRAGLRLSINGG